MAILRIPRLHIRTVREGIAGMELCPDYAERIDQFRRDYLILVEDFGFSVIVIRLCKVGTFRQFSGISDLGNWLNHSWSKSRGIKARIQRANTCLNHYSQEKYNYIFEIVKTHFGTDLNHFISLGTIILFTSKNSIVHSSLDYW